jgi:hypothetical protein
VWEAKQASGGQRATTGMSNSTSSNENAGADMFEKKPSKLFMPAGKNYFYHQSKYGIMAYDLAAGERKWKKYGWGDEATTLAFDPKGMIIFADKVYMVNYEDGEPIWEKPVKSKGQVDFFAYAPQGLVIGIMKLNVRKVPYYELNCINPDQGTFLFEENMKIEGNLLEMWGCDAGVFYTTDRELNIWDAKTGKNAMESIGVTATGNFFDIKSWDYSAPPNGKLLTGFKGEMAYIFNTETGFLYSVNTTTAEQKKLIASPLVFEDGATAGKMEVREKGIFLSSNQNATLFDFQGKEQYRVYLPKPQTGLLWKMVAAAATVYESQRQMNDAVRQSQPRVNGAGVQTRSSFANDFLGLPGARVEVNLAGANKILHDRFQASKQTVNAHYIFTQLAEKAGGWLDGEYGIVKVDKDTGEIQKYISFGKQKEPKFIIDEITGRLFYFNGSYIECYDVK